MYNARIIQYPSGWQVRVYNQLVGFHDHRPDDWFLTDPGGAFYPLWDEGQQEYVYERVPWKDAWFNPFTEREERAPVPYDEEEVAVKKKRSIASSMNRTVNAVYHKVRSNTWDWFVTLTFDPDLVDSFDYGLAVAKLSKWLNNLRRLSPDIGYVMVPEKHKSGRYHFHGLFRACGGIDFRPSGKTDHKGNPIYNVGSYRLGWSTATRITDQAKVTKYIAKYISKDLCQVASGRKRYWCSRNLEDAPVQEVVLDKDKLQQLVSRLDDTAAYIKKIDCGEVAVTYYELTKEASEDVEGSL